MKRIARSLVLIPLIAALAACGGGGSGSPSAGNSNPGAGGGSGAGTAFTDATPANTSAVPGNYGAGDGTPYSAPDNRAAAFDRLNQLRLAAGLGAVRQAPLLDNAAQAHSDYISVNQSFGHGETSGASGFTGTTPVARAQAAGYSAYATVAEVLVASSIPQYGNDYVDLLNASPYHRMGLFYYRVDEAGVGYNTTFPSNLAIELARNPGQGAPATTAVIWPVENATSVPLQGQPETPDPIPENNGSAYGYPISVSVHENKTLTVSSFTLEGPGGATVSTKLLDHATDTNLQSLGGRHFAALLPRAPLASNTTYTVRFTGAIDGVAYTKTWTFTTL